MSLDVPLVFNDCSPATSSSVTPEIDDWLRDVARLARPAQLVVGLSPDDGRDYDPVLWFDQGSSRWWAGRYVGEISYQGRTLRIQPRFGMPALCRWLSRIYGIQLIASSGDYINQPFLLWELIAHLWAMRLVKAARHGLPHRRVDEVHRGASVRGRLMLRESFTDISTRSGLLTSVTRERRIDSVVGGIILAAYERLENALGTRARTWLTLRGRDIVEDIFAGGIKPRYDARSLVRYTPITEGYRPVVELSVSIIRQRPLTASITGEKDVSGVLLDIAEIWEIYLFNVIRDGMHSYDVVHGTREEENTRFLLRGARGTSLQRVRPDILLLDPFTKMVVGVLDAKYKNATPSREVPSGVLREDLYQMAAYLSALGPSHSLVAGFLAYPVGQDWIGPSVGENPWVLNSSADRTLSFLGVPVEPLADADGHSTGELGLITSLERALAPSLSRTILSPAAGSEEQR